MWKDGERVKKRQKTVKQVRQLGGKAAAEAATGTGEEAIKEEGEIWDKEALDALFNKTV